MRMSGVHWYDAVLSELLVHVQFNSGKLTQDLENAAEQFGQALAWLGEGVILKGCFPFG